MKKTYRVKVRVVDVGQYDMIKANSKEEAEEIAAEMFEDGDTSWKNDFSPYADITFTAEED